MTPTRAFFLALPLLISCADAAPSIGSDTQSIVDTEPDKLDILFVVDDSASMGNVYENVNQQFDRFLDTLRDANGELPSLQAAVISTDMGVGNEAISSCTSAGHDGQFRTPESSCAAITESVIRDLIASDGTRESNFTGSWMDALSCINPPTRSGCGFEQPLGAIGRALDGAQNSGASFVRDDAKLAIVIITDEDDCTAAAGSGLFTPTEAGEFGGLSSFRCTRFGLECDGELVADAAGTYSQCQPSDHPAVLHPDEIVSDLVALKGSADNVMVALIAGAPDGLTVINSPDFGNVLSPACASSLTEAKPAHRLSYFATRFTHSLIASVCDEDVGFALASTGEMFSAGLEDGTESSTDESGGCSATGASPGGLGAFFAVLLAAFWTRRRRASV